MKIGIIAGNRLLPIVLAQNIKEKNPDSQIVAICLKGETSSAIGRYLDKAYWVKVGELRRIREIIRDEGLSEWIMAGQINPLAIFKKSCWDKDLTTLMDKVEDIRPHTIFVNIINYLEKEGATFLDSTAHLRESLASEGVMNGLILDKDIERDIEFGVTIASRFVELDVGQTVVVKARSTLALESLEGTDNTIARAYKLGGPGSIVLKFSKANQDFRFDVPVVGISTLKLLKKIKAAGLVLEKNRVLILEKKKFLTLAKKYNIPVVGRENISLAEGGG
jgi:DUF1009 family protein